MKKQYLAALLLPSLLLCACSDSDNNSANQQTDAPTDVVDDTPNDTPNDDTPDDEPKMIDFDGQLMTFQALAGDTTINCEADLINLGTEGASATLKSLAFYIHDIQILADNDQSYAVTLTKNNWQQEDVALIDFTDRLDSCGSQEAKPTNNAVTGSYSLPEGTKAQSISFKVGVPFEKNHANAATAELPLNRTDMFWNWQGGYKFIRADVAVEGGSTATWNIHIGSTGCDGDAISGGTTSCNAPNRTQVTIEGFENGDAIKFDYQQLVAAANVASNTANTPPGCMSKPDDPECASIFNALGLPLGDATDAPTQSVFSLIEN